MMTGWSPAVLLLVVAVLLWLLGLVLLACERHRARRVRPATVPTRSRTRVRR